MPIPVDYRTIPFHITKVGDCGRYVGRAVYWKLYVLENAIRIIVHSVLSVQLGPGWWAQAVDPDTIRTVNRVKRSYSSQPWHSSPGAHDIYFLFLPDLVKIVTTTSHLFLPIIPDIDQWVVRLEEIRLPRNIVGHMNWLNAADKHLIDTTYAELKALMKRLPSTGVPVLIP